MTLAPNLLEDIRDVLFDCAPFKNEQQVRVLFVDSRIKAWRNKLPIHSDSFYDLVNALIELLCEKRSANNENGLALFLDVVAEQIDEGDECNQRVRNLAIQLRDMSLERHLPLPARQNHIVLARLLETRFNESELRQLCLFLGVDYENLGGAGKADKARELVFYMERRDRLAELASTGRHLRTDITWPSGFEEAPSFPPEPPPVTVEATAGPLLVKIRRRVGKWQLQVQNQSAVPLQQVTLVLRPAMTVVVSPNRIPLFSLEAGEVTSPPTFLVIRPNMTTPEDTFLLAFEVVCRTPEKMERYRGVLTIPME